ncbi:MAG: DNA internalization-related competence protein ComEC/Rec2 [Thermodesulfobacteria bacterium]|nr:DNA internalization-related competence protein ComEC/Rec2 [Thermodesulfobacteriota bacterium]
MVIRPVPISLVLVPFMVGIFGARPHYGLGYMEIASIIALGVFTFLLFSLPFLGHTKDSALSKKNVFTWVFFFSLFLISATAGYFHMKFALKALDSSQQPLLHLSDLDEKVVLTGTVDGLPVPSTNGARVRFMVEEASVHGSRIPIGQPVIASFKQMPWEELRPGQRLCFSARLFKIRNFGTPGVFDIENWWALRGIRVRAVCSGPLDLIFLKGQDAQNGPISLVHQYVSSLRFNIIKTVVHNQILDRQSKPIAIALLTGCRGWFSQRERTLFAASGVGHIFAVSGLHLAIVAGAVILLVRLIMSIWPEMFLLVDYSRVSGFLALVACGIYSGIAGFSPSSLRAFFMVAGLFLCYLLQRKTLLESALFWAAFILLVVSPFYLFDVSFQLSFFVVFFLIYLGRWFDELGSGKKPFWGNFLFAALVAFIVSAPLSAFYFQRFNPWSFFLNVSVVPVVEFLVLPLLIAALFLGALSAKAAGVLFWLSAKVIGVVSFLVSFFTESHFNWLHHFVVPPKIVELTIITALFLVLPFLFRKPTARVVWATLLCLLVFFHFLFGYERRNRDFLYLHIVDVGQGLCQVLELPDGKVMVVDAGGLRAPGFDVGERVVGPYLRRLGILSIDFLVLSHPDTDHIGGARALVEDFSVKNVWVKEAEGEVSGKFQQFLDVVKRKRIPIRRLHKEEVVDVSPKVKVSCLPPERQSEFRGNDSALVLRVSFGEGSALLPGDIQRKREAELSKVPGKIRSDVLVVPHHGAKGSSTRAFIESVQPLVALCSCGYKNMFHHPAPSVVKRYRELGVHLFRTDLSGTLDIKIARDRVITVSGYYRKGRVNFNPGSI